MHVTEVEKVIEAIREASPALLAAAHAKVNAMIVANITWAAIWSTLLGFGLLMRQRRGDRYGAWYDEATVVGWLMIALGTIGTLFCLGDVICILVAREYYALQALSQLSPLR